LTGQEYPTSAVAFSRDGSTLATGSGFASSIGGRGTITLWDPKSLTPRRIFSDFETKVETIAFTPDGQAIAARGGGVSLWDVPSGKKRFSNLARGGADRSIAISPDGRWLATASEHFLPQRSIVLISDLQSGKRILTLERRRDRITSLAFSPDGKALAVGGFDRKVALWSVPEWKKGAVFTHDSDVWVVTFAPDSKRLFVKGSFEAPGVIYGIEGPTKIAILEGDQDNIDHASFSPDGKTLVTGGHDLRLWDPASGKLLYVWVPPAKREVTNAISALAFSPDGKTLVTATWDRTVIVWDVRGEK
jgi:WD40 repeat protein